MRYRIIPRVGSKTILGDPYSPKMKTFPDSVPQQTPVCLSSLSSPQCASAAPSVPQQPPVCPSMPQQSRCQPTRPDAFRFRDRSDRLFSMKLNKITEQKSSGFLVKMNPLISPCAANLHSACSLRVSVSRAAQLSGSPECSVLRCRPPSSNQSTAISLQPSAFSHQPQRSAIATQPSASPLSHQPSPSAFSLRLQPSAPSHQPPGGMTYTLRQV